MNEVKKKNGLFSNPQDLLSLKNLLSLSFPDCYSNDILSTMENSIQYYIRRKKNIVAIVSLVPKGGCNRQGNEYPNMIYNVSSHPDFRRKGLVQKIFQRIKNEVGNEPIFLEVYRDNQPALRLYRKLGFRVSEHCEPWFQAPSYMMKFKPKLKKD